MRLPRSLPAAALAFFHTITSNIRRVPRAGRICFLVALVNACVWTIVVPPFQVPDEVTHFAYAQYLAETGKAPPQTGASPYSPQEAQVINSVGVTNVAGSPNERGIITPEAQRAFQQQTRQPLSPVGPGGASNSTNQPPLYYALEAVPYWLSPSHTLLGRLAVMRLLSALLAAATVLTTFLFLREIMPRTPWTWTVGALVVAFQPSVDFIAAGVHGDNLLYFASAATLLMLARTYRRGMTSRRAVLIGGAVAVGSLSKLTYLGLIPGIALAVLLITFRASRQQGWVRASRALALTTLVAAVPFLIYGVLNVTVWHRGSILAGGVTGVTSSSPNAGAITIKDTLEYLWEFYLPKLPFMQQNYFGGAYMARAVWVNGFIGRFGWLDYGFPGWVYAYGQYLLYGIGALAIIGCVKMRRELKQWWPLIVCFLVVGLGLVGEIADAGIHYLLDSGYVFEQARYLFPLLVLYGMIVVLALRALPRRWGPVIGACLVVLAMAHGFFAETLTISRYYG
jgi:4-amino-4-deoxy-L-arabinose transferase-like glycosyltransferase